MVADFETTVYEGQKTTEVWSACWGYLFEDSIEQRGNIDDFLDFLFKENISIICYFHNLKFDGIFILSNILHRGYSWCMEKKINKMPSKTYKTLISDKNRFYSITIKHSANSKIEFRDSLKLLPFSLDQISKAFNTEHKKLSMEYVGYRYANCPISIEEKMYIMNDVYVLKEAMEIMIKKGHDKLTIGSCCMSEFKKTYCGAFEVKEFFCDDFKSIPCPVDSKLNADSYIRKTYRGAWCYLKSPGTHHNGETYDVNSLYTSVMHSKSGNYYPVGYPHWFYNKIPERLFEEKDKVWFIHLRCKFILKPGYLPTIQIKNSFLYDSTQWLERSDFYYKDRYYDKIYKNGELISAHPELYLTMRDYELLLKHYNVYDLEVIDGCWFNGELGIFDEYIDKWFGQKQNATNKVDRTESKLFLNNLYGKLSTSDNSSYQIPYLDENGVVQFRLEIENNKDVLSIDKGSMVTAYARYFTITAAQQNYERFIYADTDSLHMIQGDIQGIEVHKSNMLTWKRETRWSEGIFLRQKTYAEQVIEEDGNPCEPHWKITCAGMPSRSKEIFLKEHQIEDFKEGLTVGGKLVPKRIPGGVVLEETNFTLKPKPIKKWYKRGDDICTILQSSTQTKEN